MQLYRQNKEEVGENRLKLFQVIARLNVGGAAVYNILLTKYLSEKGYDSRMIKGQEDPNEGYILDVTRDYEQEKLHIFIPNLKRDISILQDMVAFFKLMRLFYREKPHVVHTHTAKAGVLGRIAAFVTAVPVKVHTFHGHTFKGYFGRIRTRFFLLIEQVLGRLSDCITTETPALREDLISFKIAPQEKIKVVPLGLELDQFVDLSSYRGVLRKRLGLQEHTIIVGIVARLVPIKAVDLFLHSAKRLISVHDKVHFVIVGDGELRAELQTTAEELGLAGKVTFTGFWKDLREVYADLDIVALTSLNEGCPVSIIEALAAGKPVVATAVGGVKDVIQHGENGLLVPPGDPDRIARACADLIDSPSTRQRLADRGRRTVFENFAIQDSVDLVEQLYLSLLELKGKTPAVR
jgi:glycosyltransferase involved in cell wall biosynthesis